MKVHGCKRYKDFIGKLEPIYLREEADQIDHCQ